MLVVDDDEIVRESITALLHQADYTVIQARNGIEALTLLGRSRTASWCGSRVREQAEHGSIGGCGRPEASGRLA